MFAVIYIPNFALQAVLRPEPHLRSRPVALLTDSQPKAVVFQLTEAALAAGVNQGMTPTQAMARCPGILIKTRSDLQERAAQDVLLQVAYAFSPSIESTAPGVCTLDLKGLPDPCDEAWGNRIITLLAGFNLHAQAGVAENPSLALHAAQCARPFLAVQNSTAFLAALPIESIEPAAEMLSVLHKWGIRTLGEFTSLGKEHLAERLDGEGMALFERVSARSSRPLNLVRPTDTFEERIEFEEEIEALEPLLFFIRRFLDQLSRRLELIYLVAAEVKLRLQLASGDQHERAFRVPAPTRDVDALFRMLYTHLENVRTEHPVVALTLSVQPCRESAQQFRLFEVALRDPNQFFETLARLTALVGSDRVGTPVVEQTHRPDVFRMQPMGMEISNLKSQISNQSTIHDPPSTGLSLRRFRPPINAEVEVRNGKPAFLRAAKIAGPIEQTAGPWRSSGDWWGNDGWARDEWDVRVRAADLYRLFQQQERWFLEGRYD